MHCRIQLLVLLGILNAFALYDENLFIVKLSNDNFKELVTKSKSIWIVEFYIDQCSECHKFSKHFSQTAQVFEGIVQFGAVNAEENIELVQEQDVGKYPTLIVFNGPKGLPQVYTDKREVKALTSFITVTIYALVNMKLNGALYPAIFKSKFTDDLNESNFQDLVLKSKKMWLVVIYAHASAECVRLFKEWDFVEQELNGIIKMGSLEAISNYLTAGECKLFGYPTIKFFPRGRKKISFGITYTGKYTAREVVDWAFSTAAETNPLPKVVQIKNNVDLEDACSQKRMCIVAFFPENNVCSDDCRNDYLKSLEILNLEFKKQFWGWAWCEGKTQPKLEEALKINDVYPCLTAINLRTNKYAISFDSFTIENATKFFLKSVLSNDLKYLVKKDIEIVNVDYWNDQNNHISKEEL
ncbi:hypothetical protein RN001_009549 [Aquatica leii]|uniref:Thioredoxin domain-containing protein n=1 Tax=Aquatica leii TaxID=1421715 RepID=A0AAN7P6T2_9COLE|nr:hypothetical protein RN001_009549 [Aquatica leii]